jgi:hypothetical protein
VAEERGQPPNGETIGEEDKYSSVKRSSAGAKVQLFDKPARPIHTGDDRDKVCFDI